MISTNLRRTTPVAIGAVMTCLLAVPAYAHSDHAAARRAVSATGPTYRYDQTFAGVTTRVTAVSTGSGRTIVFLDVEGMPRQVWGQRFGAHVHVNACGADSSAAGGHYTNPGAPAGTPVHDREIWLDFTVEEGGTGSAHTMIDWLIQPGTANSVMIHALPTNTETGAAGGRVLCTTVPFGYASAH